MEKGTDIAILSKMKTEIQELKEAVQDNASKEDVCLFRLEDYCNSLKGAIVNSTLNLPSISSFRFYLSKLKEQDNIEYILGLLHECWILAYPDKMFESTYKDNDAIKILENSLCKYSNDVYACNGSSSYDVVSEELNVPANVIVSSAYYRKLQKSEMLPLFREYLDMLYGVVHTIYNYKGLSIGKDFIPVCSLQVALNREQLFSLFAAIASAGFMVNDSVTRHSFLSLFSNTLHITGKKIKWLDRNEKNNQPSVASLYVMFSAMKVEMNAYNKKIICKLFNDADDKPISPESLKPRKESQTLSKVRTLVDDICKN
mgnify:CR=1 FL=1